MSDEEVASSTENQDDNSEEEVKPPPKKRAKEAAKKVKDDEADGGDNKTTKPKKARRRYVSDNPKMIEMVTEAIENLADGDRTGSSVKAIKGFINSHYAVREDMMKHVLKRALKNGLQEKVIARPPSQADKEKLTILNGRYILVRKKAAEPTAVRARPASLRQFKAPKSKKGKKKKKRRAY